MSDAATEVVEHGPCCECTRCRGFEPGNTLAVRHGAYASAARLAADPETRAIADEIRNGLPVYHESYEGTIESLAITRRRIQRAQAACEVADDLAEGKPLANYLIKDAASLRALRDDLRGWIRLARQLEADLGMNPLARSRLGLNLVRAEESAVVRLQREAREREREGVA